MSFSGTILGKRHHSVKRMAHECAFASFSNRWSKELALFCMCLCDSEKDFLKKRVITPLREQII